MEVMEEDAEEDFEVMGALRPSEAPYLKTSVLAVYKRQVQHAGKAAGLGGDLNALAHQRAVVAEIAHGKGNFIFYGCLLYTSTQPIGQPQGGKQHNYRQSNAKCERKLPCAPFQMRKMQLFAGARPRCV